ncbi:MAG: hypothetical protein R2941_16845 [Desulfobacterales bacterium]
MEAIMRVMLSDTGICMLRDACPHHGRRRAWRKTGGTENYRRTTGKGRSLAEALAADRGD